MKCNDNSVSENTIDDTLTPTLLDDIIDRLVRHDNYPGYTISETKVPGED